MISLQNVSLSSTAVTVLRDISINIAPGECVAIVGSNGSGKSLLLSTILGEIKPDKGTILVDGLPLEKLSPKLLQLYRQNLGALLQYDQLLPDRSIASNVALALEIRKIEAQEIAERTVKILKSVGLEEKIAMLPEALNHNERRLIALAQAVIAHPQILILDEPLGTMESSYAETMLKILKVEKDRGITIIMATNNPKSIQILNTRTVRLEKGRMIESERRQSVQSHNHSITPTAI